MTQRSRRAGSGVLRLLAMIFVGALLSTALVACSSDKPEVCGSVDNLKKTWDELKNMDLSVSGVDAVKEQVELVRNNLDQVIIKAGQEYKTQIDDLKSGADQLETTATAAKADPSTSSVAALAAAVSQFATYVTNMVDAVADTC